MLGSLLVVITCGNNRGQYSDSKSDLSNDTSHLSDDTHLANIIILVLFFPDSSDYWHKKA